MEFSWFTFAAQVVNFLILLWLLQRFLFEPVTHVMEERRERVTARLREAEEREEEAEAEAERLREKREQLDERRDEILEEARRDADERKQEIVEEAREEGKRIESRWRESLQREQEEFIERLRDEASGAIVRAVRDAVEDLSDEELDAAVRRAFLRRLGELDDDARTRMREAASDVDEVSIATAFDVDEDARGDLRQRVREVLDRNVNVSFERDADLSAGIELLVASHRVGWSVRTYLEDLEQRLRHALASAADAVVEETAEDEGRNQGMAEADDPDGGGEP